MLAVGALLPSRGLLGKSWKYAEGLKDLAEWVRWLRCVIPELMRGTAYFPKIQKIPNHSKTSGLHINHKTRGRKEKIQLMIHPWRLKPGASCPSRLLTAMSESETVQSPHPPLLHYQGTHSRIIIPSALCLHS